MLSSIGHGLARSLLATVLALVTVLGLVAWSATAGSAVSPAANATASSTAVGSSVETGVGASTPATVNLVGVHESVSAGQRWGHPPPEAGSVVGRGVAANVEDGAFRLIGANRATIDPRKLTEYALNPNHPVGGNKARVFESALGFNRSNADDLMAQLCPGVMENTPIPGKVDKWGTRFTVDIPVTGPAGSGVVRTGWIYTPGSTTPSLNTLMVR